MESSPDQRNCQSKLFYLQQTAPQPRVIPCEESVPNRPPQYGPEFHGSISRHDAEELIHKAADGAYLIRESQHGDKLYTLVIRFEGVAKNFKLYYDPDAKEHYVGEQRFKSIEALVENGLIHFNIQTHGSDLLQNIARANLHERNTFNKHYHVLEPNDPNAIFERLSLRSPREPISNNQLNEMHTPRRISVTPAVSPYRRDSDNSNGVYSSNTSISTKHNHSGRPSLTIPTEQPFGPRRFSADVPIMDRRLGSGPHQLITHSDPFTDSSSTAAAANPNINTSLSVHVKSTEKSPFKPLPIIHSDSFEILNVEEENVFSPDLQKSSSIKSDVPERELVLTPTPDKTPEHKDIAITAFVNRPYVTTDSIKRTKRHNFTVRTFALPHTCNFCAQFMWGVVNQGVKCTDCGQMAHKTCSLRLPEECVPAVNKQHRVFGLDLTNLVISENKTIPTVLERCVNEVERRNGLVLEGIYRVPGSQDRVESLKIAFDKGPESASLTPNRVPDVHVITSLIKLFLRQLPVPLICPDVYAKLVAILNNDELFTSAKLDSVRVALSELPPAYMASLRFFINHIFRVAAHREQNMMSIQNLAVVISPSLISSNYTDAQSCISGMQQDQNLMEFLIRECEHIFPSDSIIPKSPVSKQNVSPSSPPTPTTEHDFSQLSPISSISGRRKKPFLSHRRSIFNSVSHGKPPSESPLDSLPALP